MTKCEIKIVQSLRKETSRLGGWFLERWLQTQREKLKSERDD